MVISGVVLLVTAYFTDSLYFVYGAGFRRLYFLYFILRALLKKNNQLVRRRKLNGHNVNNLQIYLPSRQQKETRKKEKLFLVRPQ